MNNIIVVLTNIFSYLFAPIIVHFFSQKVSIKSVYYKSYSPIYESFYLYIFLLDTHLVFHLKLFNFLELHFGKLSYDWLSFKCSEETWEAFIFTLFLLSCIAFEPCLVTFLIRYIQKHKTSIYSNTQNYFSIQKQQFHAALYYSVIMMCVLKASFPSNPLQFWDEETITSLFIIMITFFIIPSFIYYFSAEKKCKYQHVTIHFTNSDRYLDTLAQNIIIKSNQLIVYEYNEHGNIIAEKHYIGKDRWELLYRNPTPDYLYWNNLQKKPTSINNTFFGGKELSFYYRQEILGVWEGQWYSGEYCEIKFTGNKLFFFIKYIDNSSSSLIITGTYQLTSRYMHMLPFKAHTFPKIKILSIKDNILELKVNHTTCTFTRTYLAE